MLGIGIERARVAVRLFIFRFAKLAVVRFLLCYRALGQPFPFPRAVKYERVQHETTSAPLMHSTTCVGGTFLLRIS